MALIERVRTPLIPAVLVAALALAPPAWLGWAAEVGAVLWIPLNPIAHLAASAREWLRPPRPDLPPVEVEALLEERETLRALASRLRIELDLVREELAALEGEPRPSVAMAAPLAATVLSVEPDGRMRINKGLRHGIASGDPAVAGGEVLVGRVADPPGAAWATVVPAMHRASGSIRARLLRNDDPDAPGMLVLLEPTGDGWRGETAAGLGREGASLRLDDSSWPAAAQGLLLGRVAKIRRVDARPLLVEIAVEPAWDAGAVATLVVRRGVVAETAP
ncbi:MAG: hypothetical protein ACO3ZY_14200 [Phycisphaerales bacterium]